MKFNEKAHEAIVFGVSLALLILIVLSALLSGGGRELYPTLQGRGSLAGTPVRTPANSSGNGCK